MKTKRDSSRRQNIMLGALVSLCLMAFLAEFLVYRKAYFGFENIPGIHGIIGFVAAVLVYLIGRWVVGTFLSRSEDYYE